MMHGTHNVTLTHYNMMHGTHNVTLTLCNMMHGTRNVTLTHYKMMHGTHITLTHCNMMHGAHNVTLTLCNMMHGTHNITLIYHYFVYYVWFKIFLSLEDYPNSGISYVLCIEKQRGQKFFVSFGRSCYRHLKYNFQEFYNNDND